MCYKKVVLNENELKLNKEGDSKQKFAISLPSPEGPGRGDLSGVINL